MSDPTTRGTDSAPESGSPPSPSELDSGLTPKPGPAPAPARRLRATALAYEPGARAPLVVASGQGEVAKRIIELAEQAGVPVRSDPALSAALEALQIEAEVPPELYRAVAEALAWAYKLNGALAGR